MPTELQNLGLLATQIKTEIVGMRGIRLTEVRQRVEERIREAGYQVLFPVNVNPGSILSHGVPAGQTGNLGDEDYTTVDFGIKGSEYLIDTAVTVVKQESQSVLSRYREAMDLAISRLQDTYRKDGSIKIREITKIIQEAFSSFTVVEECCGHQIKGFELYHRIVPMASKRYCNRDGDSRLTEGSLITIQPHVALQARYRMRQQPSGIVRNGDLYEHNGAKDSIPSIVLNSPGFYEERMIYFDMAKEPRAIVVT